MSFCAIIIYMVANLQKQISQGIRAARLGRRLSQLELAKKLGISQSRLSEIEQGKGSITAEQFVILLQFFNLPISYFVSNAKSEFDLRLQNALAYYGAKYLRKNEVAIMESQDVNDVIIETLTSTNDSRLLTALAPIVVNQYHKINFDRIVHRMLEHRILNRFAWILDGTSYAINERFEKTTSFLGRDLSSKYDLALKRLNIWLTRLTRSYSTLWKTYILESSLEQEDLLDMSLKKSDKCDDLANKWRIITRIKKEDFYNALLEMEKS